MSSKKTKESLKPKGRLSSSKTAKKRKTTAGVKPSVNMSSSSELCERCGKNPVWATHHKDGRHDNDKPANLWRICEPCHAFLEDRAPNLSEIRVLYETVKDLEKTRIMIENRVRSQERQWQIDSSLLSEQLKLIKKMEKDAIKRMIKLAEEYPVFEWLVSIRGVAGKTAAQLIALIGDIGRFRQVASIWHYSGLHVVDGAAPRRKKGQKIDYMPRLKSLTLGIIAECMIRAKSPYKKLYDEKKAFYEKERDWTKLHRHRAAIRFMVKAFMKNLWQEWRKVEALDHVAGETHCAPVKSSAVNATITRLKPKITMSRSPPYMDATTDNLKPKRKMSRSRSTTKRDHELGELHQFPVSSGREKE